MIDRWSCRMTAIVAVAVLAVAGRPVAAADDGRAAARIFESTRGGLVAIDYTVRQDAGSAVISAVGVIVRGDGLVMASLDYFPEQFQDADISDIEISLESDSGQRSRVFEGALLGRDRVARAAFLSIEGADDERLPSVSFQAMDDIDLGERVMILGVLPENLGRRRYFTLARVAAAFTEPRVQYGLAMELMPGALPSPGSPVLDLKGRAIGVLQNLGVDDNGDRGRSLATLWPTSNFAAALQTPPDPARADKAPWIGIIGMQDVSRKLAEYWRLPAAGGVVVGYVIPGSPAEDAGLTADDVILDIDGRPVHTRVGSSVQYLIDLVRRRDIGQTLKLRVWSGGDVRDVAVALRERPKEPAQAERFRVEGEFRFTVRELVFMDRFARDLPVSQAGVMASFVQPGWAVDGGLESGDIITHIDADPVADLGAFEKVWQRKVEAKPKEIVLTVIRGDTNENVLVRIACVW